MGSFAKKYLKITMSSATMLEIDPLFRDLLRVRQMNYNNVRMEECVIEQE